MVAPSADESAPPGVAAEMWRGLRDFAKPVTGLLESLGQICVLLWESISWGLRPPYRIGQFLIHLDFIGVQSIFIVALTGTFTGMVLALQLVYQLRIFGAESVVGLVVAISLMREISPVFTALMVTARGGSAIAAELGNMRVTEQIDALVTMGVSPIQYLVSPRVIAAILMVPLLCVLFTCVGMIGAWFVAVKGLGIDPGQFISRIESAVQLSDFLMGQIKSAVFGFLIAVISAKQGFYASGGARGVGQATTRAVVQSAIAILVSNYILTSLMTSI